jgi:hypothetical protein
MHPSELNPKLRPVTVAVLTALSLAPALSQAASPAPGAAQGSQFQVNTYTSGSQGRPAIARDAAGDFVVTWQSEGQDGSGYGIYAQRYDAAGTAQGSEFRVNTYTSSNQTDPAIAINAVGDFVVAWQSYDQDGSLWGIYAQRYNAAGVAQGSEFQVNTYTSRYQYTPSVAMDAAGDFVVSWASGDEDGSDYGIYAQRYSAAGIAQGSEFKVNTHTSGLQFNSSVAMDAAGDFVVSWTSYGQNGNYFGIFAQRYNAAGVAQGSEFQVNMYISDDQDHSSVAMDAAGDFVVSWQSYIQDGSGYGIFAQRYNAAGVAQGSEFQVNTHTLNSQSGPSVTTDAVGDFVVTWTSYDSHFGIFAQRYNAAGAAQGSEFQVNTATSDDQYNTAVAMDAAGDFVVSWQGFNPDDDGGVYVRLYARSASLDLATSLTLAPTGSVTPGDDETLTADVTNTEAVSTLTGNTTIDAAINTAFGVTAALTLPSGVTFKSASGTNWTCPSSPSGSVLTCTYSGSLSAASTSDALTVTVTPNFGDATLDFSSAVSSDQPDSNSSNDTASGSVTTPDTAPVASDGTLSTSEGTAVNGTLKATDTDSIDTLTYSVVTQPAHGSVSVTASTSAYKYTPRTGYSGSDSFTFKANDGTLDSNTATVSVTVTASSSSENGSGSSSGGGGALGLLSLLFVGLLTFSKRRRTH